MSEQDGAQVPAIQRPTTNDREKWKAYWKREGQPWRKEPEIDEERQQYLSERRKIKPDIKHGTYPFKDIKLNRADVEWLLATHENGRGHIDWSDESQRGRYGLDLRGADLRGAYLAYLPLTGMCRVEDELETLYEMTLRIPRPDAGAVHLEEANLWHAHLERADLSRANLEKAEINEAYLEKADFSYAHLKEASFWKSDLKGAWFWDAHLEGADLSGAHLEATIMKFAHLEGANLQGAFLDGLTLLNDSTFGDKKSGAVALADVHWGDVNIAVVDWSAISVLGDEVEAKKSKSSVGRKKRERERFSNYQTAVRAYRQLSVVLRNQGLNEDAARIAYRGQKLQKTVFRLHGGVGSWMQFLFSWFLDLLAGYGYKPWRSFAAYLLVITAFATTYFIIGQTAGPALSLIGSAVFSMTSFHGRGFFPGGIGLDDPLTVLAALEAFVGLLIEVTFIATLTQRLFGK